MAAEQRLSRTWGPVTSPRDVPGVWLTCASADPLGENGSRLDLDLVIDNGDAGGGEGGVLRGFPFVGGVDVSM
jgi:hypothetical protein